MTMKRKIFISNTIMVLISLLIMFGIITCGALLFEDQVRNVVKQNAEVKGNVTAVETIIKDEKSYTSWKQLDDKLQIHGFDLYVSNENNDKIYSTVSHRSFECVEELEDNKLGSKDVHLYSMEGITIARYVVTVDDVDYNVYATYSAGQKSIAGMDRGMFEMFIIVFISGGILIIIALLLCSQIFTKMMIKRIMKPVDQLNSAVNRINDGNFEEPIIYEKNDEFAEVCNTFNEMQKHLKMGFEQREAYEKARTEMISGISHDLRTPLTSVKGFIKGMLDGVATTPEKQRQYLDISYKKACDMDVLLQKLFFISKLETGNMPFFKEDINLSPWLVECIEDKQLEDANKACELSFISLVSDAQVHIDPTQTKRIFDNLIENSIKYADVHNIKIDVSLTKDDKWAIITIKDNGKGISDDKLSHVFEQFYRGDESRTSKNEGSGLGLYVCKYIVEEQGGEITANNKDGFSIEVKFPLVNREEISKENPINSENTNKESI